MFWAVGFVYGSPAFRKSRQPVRSAPGVPTARSTRAPPGRRRRARRRATPSRPRAAPVGRVGDVVEGAPVGDQRVGEVGPGDPGSGRGDLQRPAARARPRDERAVGHHHPVLESPERERDPAAVGRADRADLGRVDQVLVGEEAHEELRVADLVAGVVEADVAVRAAVGVGVLGGLRAARLAEAAVGHREDGVTPVEPLLHAREADLAAAVAVERADQRIVAVGAGGGLGREGDVDVDRDAVEGLDG